MEDWGGGGANDVPKSGSLTHNRVRSPNTYKYIHPDVASIMFTLQMMALNTVMFGLIFFPFSFTLTGQEI